MPAQKYVRPPIVEAILELRFSASIDRAVMEMMSRELRTNFPNAEQTYNVDFEMKLDKSEKEPEVRPTKTLQGYKLIGKDGADIVLVNVNSLNTIRLAPYEGWDILFEKTKAHYAKLYKITGYRGFSRVATRYINRIDVPRTGRDRIDTADYLLTEPRIPPRVPAISSFQTSFAGLVPSINGGVTVRAAIVPSPLIDHMSLLLDIDLYKDGDLPQKESAVWELLLALREEKNALFESFVTDKARELFNRA